MLTFLLISLTLLATCFFGLWQMLMVPRRAVLQSRLDTLNELLASHRTLSARMEAGQEGRGDWHEETGKYGLLYERIFIDDSIDANKDLPEGAKVIIAKYRTMRLSELGETDKHIFTDVLLGLHETPVELDFCELSILIEYAIKKLPYYPSRLLDPGVWLASIRRKKSLSPSSSRRA